MRNRGTYEGELQEKDFVTQFNKNKTSKNYSKYLRNFLQFKEETLFMVRVTTTQYSNLSEKKVKTRADAYLIHTEDLIINELLLENNYYLDETILFSNKVNFSPIDYSGISIKINDSNNYQILKLTPKSFNKLFLSYELGAGACLYCKKKQELEKNLNLIIGWNTNQIKMEYYFSNIIKDTENFYLNINTCKQIKNYSINKICNLIDTSENLKIKIFNGINLYNEPYTAHFIFKHNSLNILSYIPYNISTGSGRSKGSYTLVLKPK